MTKKIGSPRGESEKTLRVACRGSYYGEAGTFKAFSLILMITVPGWLNESFKKTLTCFNSTGAPFGSDRRFPET